LIAFAHQVTSLCTLYSLSHDGFLGEL